MDSLEYPLKLSEKNGEFISRRSVTRSFIQLTKVTGRICFSNDKGLSANWSSSRRLRESGERKISSTSLDKTWNNYRESIARYRSLVDENSMEIHEVNNQYASQELRKDNYDRKIKEFTIAAATHFNEQVSRDLANIGLASPTPSVRSVSSRASKLS